ncbi:type VI secretion system baseplate subunit TssK [Arcobacter sp. LA11]|uniref:type VI secretion system baseplate subunit TssK n=1 Tax=Arcobacter sp. LA11 TaxID=1898176 RepID=UPI000934E7A9|nr:type VI secretion system baseplate subunit TssK [Arcobacter sp. LA11]
MENKVIWREGLFIRPQHFQQNDRYYNYELMTRTYQSRQNNWGFFEFKVNEHLLSTSKIIIESASGIMPDGTLFNINSKDSYTLSLDINTSDMNKYVYLSLPINIKNSDEVHFEEHKNLLTRYKSKTIPNIPNTNTGEVSNSDLSVAQHNFKLQLEDQLSDSYINIQIAKIGNVSNSGIVSLDETFVPSYMHLNSSKYLLSKINELTSMLSYRAEKLAQKVSDSVLQASELGDYLMLQVLNKYNSSFHFLLTQDKIHPDELFRELTILAGELAIFMKKEKRLLKQFNYDHFNQTTSFEDILEELKSMLTMVLEQNSISLPVEERKYGIYIVPLKDKELIENSSFIFSVNADLSAEKIKEILVTSLKIGTIETIKNLVNYHLVGFKIKPLSNPPKEIPYRINHLYFKLELSGKNKKELLKSAGFAFHLSSKLPNVNYALWAIKNN